MFHSPFKLSLYEFTNNASVEIVENIRDKKDIYIYVYK